MTHYAENPGMTRFDFFNPVSGKWKYTEALDMSPFWDMSDLFDAARSCVVEQSNHPLNDYMISVLEPYHKHGCPIMLMPEVAR